MKKFNTVSISLILLVSTILFTTDSVGQKLQVNDLEYFETRGVNVFVFSNQYNGMFFDEKTAGIEIIHHGVRTATGGAVRLQHTPEQWDLIPTVVDRKVDKKNNSIDVVLQYKEYDFNSRVNVSAKDDGVTISVYLEKPLPEKLEGHAGFNLEFLPASYFEKTYLVDGMPGVFPLYPSSNTAVEPISKKIPQFAGHSTFDDRGRGEFIVPKPLASGKTIVLAPEDPERYVKIQSADEIMLFDGRLLAQNGWYIVRSLIPPKKSGKVLEWYVEPNAIPDWKRAPVIQFSQVGYHLKQEKVAVIELDKNDTPLKTASIFQVTPEGEFIEKLTADLKPWGKYLRYNYVTFDFTSVKDPGLYFIKYGEQKTNTFIIGTQVYHDIWHPTLDVWFPAQMDHMLVNEAYRVWHGVPYLDDALQAPVNHQHFDGYSMGPTTDTKYKSLERIPGLAVGGWFDAGDFDIQTASHCGAILSFVNAWEEFGLDRDETYIDQATRYVDIHRSDGKPDLLQQIEHGTLNVVAQIKNIGHPVRGIVVPNLHQYHHLGDASIETDNLPYNPALKPYESDGKSSGAMDDRWAFTNRMPWLDYFAIGALAAANRALRNYNKPLADECLALARNLWDEHSRLPKSVDTSRAATWFRSGTELTAALQLFITTKEEQYSKRFNEIIWPALDRALAWSMSAAVQAYPYMDDEYKSKLKDYVLKYKGYVDGLNKENPYGVPMIARGWGGNSMIINWAITNYFANKAFPDIIGPEYVYKGLNYIFGCHPYSNISFVSSVGTVSKKITYGSNRADFSFIAGGVVPGLLLLKPDFPENKEDWPFLWGENECVVNICADYIFLSGAVNALVNKKN
ncbi:MAG: glycoside hydrolase family 9 protein [candidate division KSB1 bacterium]|nr:glycoside hydrolase family 9 protein [candidate division KSB1 bacterium]MDZ7302533.1 glycoside hydrolase family 9 protein [candidate division KSB1 bacterium]